MAYEGPDGACKGLSCSRRDVLRFGLAAAAAASGVGAAAADIGAQSADDAARTQYKALVCILLAGGNNGHNWLVPLTESGYRQYAKGRSNLALPRASLLPLNGVAPGTEHTYGLHPSCPELQALFNNGNAAFVCNVGTLVQPVTRAQALAGSVSLPPQLFSHIDQQTEWLTGIPQSVSKLGWGGRVADLLTSRRGRANLAYNINVGGANYWQDGRSTLPYSIGTGGAPTYGFAGNRYYRDGGRARATQDLITQAQSDTNLLVREYAGILDGAANKVTLVNRALRGAGEFKSAWVPAVEGDWGLGQQLSMVARLIRARAAIRDARQMFFVQIGAFDTHNDELATQARLLGFLSRHMKAFWDAMVEIGAHQDVTVFTVSDFGRTLTSNGNGADHGWGNHHLVMGGAVKGGTFHGSMPDLRVDGPDDFGLGRIIPTTSADQYAATLARWFGLSNADLVDVFPNLINFRTTHLDFLG
jgi:uncharacterized protein (DUF1501 family)